MTHEDTYKPGVTVPPIVTTISAQMASLLKILDDMAQTLREALDEYESADVPERIQASATAPRVSTSRLDGDADGYVQEQATDHLRRLVNNIVVPTPSATLAWQLRQKLGTGFDAGWFGYGSFKQLLEHAVPGIRLENTPPGLVLPHDFDSRELAPRKESDVPPGIPSIAARLKRLDRSFPLASSHDLRNVYRYLQDAMLDAPEEVNPSIQYVNLITKRARDRMSEDHAPAVPRSTLTYVMKALLFSEALTDIPTSDEIGRLYAEQTTERAKSLLGDVSATEIEDLCEWLQPNLS